MSTGILIDTYKTMQRFQGAGFDQQKAEAFTETLKEAFENVQSDLVTKADLREIRSELQGVKSELKFEIQEVRSELKTDLKELEMKLENKILQLEGRLIKWGIGLQITSITIILSFLKIFH